MADMICHKVYELLMSILNIYIYQKNYETIGYMMLYIFTRIQQASKLYFKYTV
jgi:hypothetical protein